MGVYVITGSTRGLGFGLARALLDLGQRVCVSGRAEAAVDAALERLGRGHTESRYWGMACDVTDADAVQALWDGAFEHFGQLDVWINNAGVMNPPKAIAEMSRQDYEPVMATNLLGTMNGCAVALRGMKQQGGALWNMEGLGSDGRIVANSTPYGTTKYGVAYLTRALVKEAEGTKIRVGSIQPGMVVTDLLKESLEQYPPRERKRVRRIFNTLADPVETVAPWIARRLVVSEENGAQINRLTKSRLAWKLVLAPLRRRELFSDVS